MTRRLLRRPTRRQVLGGAAGFVAAAAWRVPAVRAAIADPVALGEAEATILTDGHLNLPLSFALPEQRAEEIAALLEPHGLPTDAIRPDCNITLFRTADRLVLLDAGAGPMFQDTAGRLPESLAEAGIGAEDITDIIFTHGHPDHLWGVIDDFDEPVFPEASYWVPQAEWDFWRADDTLSNMPEAGKAFVVGARNRFDAIEERVSLVKPGDEPVPGVEAIDTSGHTPGHTSYMLHGNGESMLVVGDAISHPVISFEKPGWHSGADQDREKGAATRRALLERIVVDNARIVGFHLPYPGIGTAERQGEAYRFVPI
ncbi:MBL fold metallo-hydrolase [Lutibaculum baratangense]|uniref:Metallo-beta-lactamase family protein n=1 Tax=Lutibaculum baratangense AMV1 TaxID=631454 RepID=V4R5P7_9HYPH|nr:MBL fold metallo-hydrolase [Lutibaculum baratangense]ESR27277.1 metallo-beta-lactamase family protein [Lutibaculum baratangense AMV1]